MLEGNEDLLHFLKGEPVFFFPAKGTILHSFYVHCFSDFVHSLLRCFWNESASWPHWSNRSVNCFFRVWPYLSLLHGSERKRNEYSIVCCAIGCWFLTSGAFFSLEAGLATEKLDPVHPTDPTAGQWLCSVGKTDVIFRHACLMI